MIDRLRTNGRILAFGVGCESIDVAASWLDVDGLDCVQLPYGVLDPQGVTVVAEARRRGIGVVVRGALGGGVLGRHLRREPTGLDPTRADHVRQLDALATRLGVELGQLAVWFARESAAIDALLLGASNVAQLDACVRWSTTPPPEASVVTELRTIVGQSAPA